MNATFSTLPFSVNGRRLAVIEAMKFMSAIKTFSLPW